MRYAFVGGEEAGQALPSVEDEDETATCTVVGWERNKSKLCLPMRMNLILSVRHLNWQNCQKEGKYVYFYETAAAAAAAAIKTTITFKIVIKILLRLPRAIPIKKVIHDQNLLILSKV